MKKSLDEFVQLDRTFHDLVVTESGDNEAELRRLVGRDKKVRWDDLLTEHRVIILSEAGSGKTEEIRRIAQDLRGTGKAAFFIRIEFISSSFDASFEEGTSEEFADWLASDRVGWLLLDSVDEARLRDPRDFELAIRKLSKTLHSALQRVHIVLTGRTSAWRPKTDLRLCSALLPYRKPQSEGIPATDHNEATHPTAPASAPSEVFRLVALDDLYGNQIDTFAAAKGVKDIKTFRSAIEKKDAWSFTTRPLDLAELIEFWQTNRRIGSRLELIRASIKKRLEELDQNRADANPIATARIRTGARLLAAALTMSKQSSIQIPDGQHHSSGLPTKDVLTDWTDQECATLLSRPIFDEGLYGTVRFHHRSVREFLTAEWLHDLLVKKGSRHKVEALLFQKQYGVEVIVPTLRPILPWLALLDGQILDRVMKLAPEVLFEGGDPSEIPLETRRKLLRRACKRFAADGHDRAMLDYVAVQRFASADLAEEIVALLNLYSAHDDIVCFLLRLVSQGEILAAAYNAAQFADPTRSKYTQIAAIRATELLGSADELTRIRNSIVNRTERVPRAVIAELLPSLPATADGILWLVKAIENSAGRKQFETDPLGDALLRLSHEWPLETAVNLNQELIRLIQQPPHIERRYCAISQHFGWTGCAAANITSRLITAKHPAAIQDSTLALLRLLPVAQDCDRHAYKDLPDDLAERVRSQPDLAHALFWHCVREERVARTQENENRLTDFFPVTALNPYFQFGTDDFERVCDAIASRPLLDDRLVALTLAYDIYRRCDRPRAWREKLKRLVKNEKELASKLSELLKPAAQQRQSWRRSESMWKRRNERQEKREADAVRKSREELEKHLDSLRDPAKGNLFISAQAYLYHRMEFGTRGVRHRTEADWKALTEDFGEAIAQAFRDGAVRYWRTASVPLRSEGAPANQTPFTALLGLAGIAIEARESQDWLTNVSNAEAILATRYAVHELNGFPDWLPRLYAEFPEEVAATLMNEIKYELSVEAADSETVYVLHTISWNGQWLWDRIAPELIGFLELPRKNVRNLGYLLSIVHGSSIENARLAEIFADAVALTNDTTLAASWYAAWTGVDPDAAIPALVGRLESEVNREAQLNLAMRFVVALIGGRSLRGSARDAHRTVPHLKSLYLLMNKYIRRSDDIERAGQGAYSPGLRDDAQDARNTLFQLLKDMPGKESFLALTELASEHPEPTSRKWMSAQAQLRATEDADTTAWMPRDVRSFEDTLTRTPTDHRELWQLAVERLAELKYDLEEGDSSLASILLKIEQETEFRKYIGNWCRDRAAGHYSVPQEEQLADDKRPDLRFFGAGFDAPVPVELKIADRWTGPALYERLENQLCGDYLRDERSNRGVFLLVNRGKKKWWEFPDGMKANDFQSLLNALRTHWTEISSRFPRVEDIAIVGIDLTKRGTSPSTT